jgi:hypothetical protein
MTLKSGATSDVEKWVCGDVKWARHVRRGCLARLRGPHCCCSGASRSPQNTSSSLRTYLRQGSCTHPSHSPTAADSVASILVSSIPRGIGFQAPSLQSFSSHVNVCTTSASHCFRVQDVGSTRKGGLARFLLDSLCSKQVVVEYRHRAGMCLYQICRFPGFTLMASTALTGCQGPWRRGSGARPQRQDPNPAGYAHRVKHHRL